MKPAEGSTVIGKSVIIRGELSGSEDLFLDGEIEGTITLAESRLTVGPNARVHADISVQDVIVFGRIEGNVRATGRLELRQSSSVIGDIQAGRLSIEESASLRGRVELTEHGTVGTRTASPASAPAQIPVAPAAMRTVS